MMTSGILSKIIGQKTTKNLNKKENGMQRSVADNAPNVALRLRGSFASTKK